MSEATPKRLPDDQFLLSGAREVERTPVDESQLLVCSAPYHTLGDTDS